MAFEKLFEPIQIGPVKIKNRLAVAPMNGAGDRNGHPTRQYTCYFNARALGGFGLLTTGSIITNKQAHMEQFGRVPGLYNGSLNTGFYSEFTESIHSMGTDTKIFAQLANPRSGRLPSAAGRRDSCAVDCRPSALGESGLRAAGTVELAP